MYIFQLLQCPVQEVRNMLYVWRPETYTRPAQTLVGADLLICSARVWKGEMYHAVVLEPI